MTKKALLWIIVLFLLSSFVSAVSQIDETNIITYYNGNSTIDEVGNYNLTANNGATYSSFLYGNGFYTDGTNDYFNTDDINEVEGGKPFTLMFWADNLAVSSTNPVLQLGQGGQRNYGTLRIYLQNANTIRYAMEGRYQDFGGLPTMTSNKFHIAIIDNGSAMNQQLLYVNGTEYSPTSTTYTQELNLSGGRLYLGYEDITSNYKETKLDQMLLLDFSANSTIITDDYNNGAGRESSYYITPPFTTSVSLDYFNLTPDNPHAYDTLTLNATCTGTNTSYNINYSLYVNGVYNLTYSGTTTINNNTITTIKTIPSNSFNEVNLNYSSYCSIENTNSNVLTEQEYILPSKPIINNINTITGLNNITFTIDTQDNTNLSIIINGTNWNITSYNQNKTIIVKGLSPRTVYAYNLTVCNIQNCTINSSSRQTRTIITTRGYEFISNDLIGSINATLNIAYTGGETETITKTSTSGAINFIVGSNTYYTKTLMSGNITLKPTDYLNTGIYNFMGLSSLTNHYPYLYNFYKSILNITAYNDNNQAITTFNITLRGLNETYTINQSTNNNWTSFNLINGTYNLTIQSNTYADRSQTFTTSGLSYYNYSFTLQRGGWANIFFYDELTNSLLTTRNITFEVIGSLFSNNYSTTNGTIGTNLTQDSYTFRYSAYDYPERLYYTNIIKDKNYTFNLYLLPNTTGTIITVTLYDQNNNRVEGYTIKLLKYDLSLNSYILRDMQKTDVNGEARLNAVLNKEFYKFIVEDPNGVTVLETTPQYIQSTSINLQIVRGDQAAENFYNSQDISSTIVFNEVTNNFRLTYSDSNNIIDQACLKIYRISAGNGSSLINNSCLTSTTGTILIRVTNLTGVTYRGTGFAYFDNEEYYLGSETHTFKENNVFGLTGLLLTIIILTVLAFVGLWNMSVAAVLVPLGLLAAATIGLIQLSYGVTIPLLVVGFIIAVILERGK